ncbi:hypothetical protein Taro_018847 [Colocasia esculenta]|uniref:Pentatricopeptide repeat-containing protein n=1 Tax=Colocasia esculenta TaxID=4460 RepID=A0A843UV32_COLES|nr:hypothetical protein [Colocasia esculenta]
MAATFPPFPAKASPNADETSTPAGSASAIPTLLRQCRSLGHLHQAHAHLIKAGLFPCHPSAVEGLLETAALQLPGGLGYALEAFRRVPRPNAAAYNVMIRGLTSGGSPADALALFRGMLVASVVPDKYTFPCVLKACSRLGALEQGEQIHARVEKTGYALQEFVQSALIHMYGICGKMDIARKLFDGIDKKGLIAWNAMFAGYSKNGACGEVVDLFHRMLESGVPFDDVTLISVLPACGRVGALDLGEWIDGYVEANGMKHNINLITSLVDMYAKCGRVGRARSLFDGMPQKDVVAWSAMISGYTQSSRCREALALFHEMQVADVEPNEVTMVSVLSACAILGALETGKWIHSFTRRKRLALTVNLGTALVDLYAKCGCIDTAIDAFAVMPRKNVLTWTALIQGLASNGRGKEALDLFSSMLEAKTQPNEVTFIALLSACGHAGLVDEGRRIFASMDRDYGVKPKIDHYGCMADILGRAGLLCEAHQFIKSMPIEPNAIVWRALLASCKVHKNVEVGEESLKQIVRLGASHSGDYILMSNIYASMGRVEDALRIRAQIRERGTEKIPGCSLIEVGGVVHEFFADDSETCSSETDA